MATAFLAVMVPEADRAIGQLRDRWDPSARQGLGAHITVRYPFLTPGAMTGEDVEALTQAAASVPAFDFACPTVGQFAGTVFLSPEPTGPFAALRAAVERAFAPRLEPDRFAEYVPHLSVARYVMGDKAYLVEQAQQALHACPISSRCTHLALIERDGGPWITRMWMPLGR